MPAAPLIAVKRVYDSLDAADGLRVLVDRLWPRGLSKDAAALDEWAKAVAPSTALRQWLHADPGRWPEFPARYRAELAEPGPAAALRSLRATAAQGKVTLLYGTRDEKRNHALVLRDVLLAVKT